MKNTVSSIAAHIARRGIVDDHKQLVMDIVAEIEARAGQRKESHPFAVLARRWERTHIQDLAKSSASDVQDTVRRLIGAFGDKTSHALTRDSVDDFLRALEDKGLSARTVNKSRGVGIQILAMAIQDQDWLEANSFAQTKRRRSVPTKQPRLTAANVIDLLVDQTGQMRRLYAAAIYTGARKSELLSWRREDVDLNYGLARIQRSRGNEFTKNRTHREFPIHKDLGPYIIEQLQSHSSDYVFCDSHGQRFKDEWDLAARTRTAFARVGVVSGYRFTCRWCGTRENFSSNEERSCEACKRRLWCAPIPQAISFHSLRRCAASFYKLSGCDNLVRKIMLGHAVSDITDSVYTDLSAGFMRRNIDKMSLAGIAKSEAEAASRPFGASPGKAGSQGITGHNAHRPSKPGVVGSSPAWRNTLLSGDHPRTVSEVANALRVHRETVYKAISDGKLKALRVGSVFRILPTDLEGYLSGGGRL